MFAGTPNVSAIGDVATDILIERLASLGAQPGRLRAKVFGGTVGALGLVGDLGIRNVEVAHTVLSRRGIPVVGQDVGGKRSRKLLFWTDTGAAWVRHL